MSPVTSSNSQAHPSGRQAEAGNTRRLFRVPLYYWGGARAALGGWNLGLLGPQQGSHLADLPLDTGSCSTAQGTVLFHAVAVVPHVTHVTGEQGAGGERRVKTDSACQPGVAQGQLPGWGWGWGRAYLMVCSSCSDSWLRATPLVSAMNTAFPEASWAWRNGI